MLQGSEPKPENPSRKTRSRQPRIYMPQPTAVPALCAANSGNCAARPQKPSKSPELVNGHIHTRQTGSRNALLPVDAIPQFAAGSGKISERNTSGSQPYRHGWRWRQFYRVDAGLT